VLGRDNEIRLIDFTLRPVIDERGNTILIIPEGRDITESRRAEEEIQRYQRELAHIMRLGTMGEMASGIAHELNQPLAALVSYCGTAVSLMNSQSSPSQQLREILDRAAKQAHRASKIVQHLREFVSKENAHKDLLDLDQLIREIIIFLKYEVQECGVTIKYCPASQSCRIRANKIQIDQVLVNLVRNSIEAISHAKIPDGRVVLQTRLLPNDSVEVTVSDNGPGIDAEMIDTIFHPFQTSKTTGMGIGLPLCRRIIETLGGKLWVEKNYQNGALFGFELPVSINNS
jgi:two-component system sensor histidine kinase TtrS